MPNLHRGRDRLFTRSILLAALFSIHQYPGAKDLNGQEVWILLIGNTVEATHAVKGHSIITYYAPDGTYREIKNGKKKHGTWRIDERDRFCTKTRGKREECHLITEEEPVWKAYNLPKNLMRSRRHKRTYHKILQGNPHDL